MASSSGGVQPQNTDIPKQGTVKYCGCPMVLSQRSSSQRSKNTNDQTRNPEVRRKAREKAPPPCKHRSIAASRHHQLEQKAQEDQTV
jgi:hypothetical protein